MKENSIVNYDGRLGKFSYDTADFEIRYKYTETGTFDYLHYKGNVQQGDAIIIPDGIVDISYMFDGKPLLTPPAIPVTVVKADYTFKDCVSLCQGAALPINLVSCAFLYQNCRSLVVGSHMPDTVENAQYMYDGCVQLLNPGHISENLKYASGMFRGCKNMRELPVLPESIERGDNIFKNCTFLNRKLNDSMY